MKISDHFDKGIWTIADKSLLLIYGFAVVVFVVRILPAEEFGAWSLFSAIFLFLSISLDSAFLQPMVKFASEHEAEVAEVTAAAFNMYSVLYLGLSIVVAVFSAPIAAVLHSKELGVMLPLLPLMCGFNIFRNVGIRVLQVDLRINAIFWVDLAFFGSIILLAILQSAFGRFHTAYDFVILNVIGATLSSLVAISLCNKEFRALPIFRVPRNEYSKLISFAKFQAGTSVLLAVQQYADTLIIGAFYAEKEVAIYNVAKTLYRFTDPVREGATLLIVPLSSQLYASKEFKSLGALVEKLLFIAFAALVPICLVLALIASPIFHLLYQGKFDNASPVFQVLILSGFTMPLSLIATNVLIGMGKVKSLFLAMLSSTVAFVVLAYILVPPLASMGAALSVFLALTLLSILTYMAMRSEIEISATGVLSRIGEARSFVKRRLDKNKMTIPAEVETENMRDQNQSD